ncbi:helix-turn-helix domain-containing protein [Christensenellaceae bacterium OttesenSCG-928-K19]|nr:helix-turn-helix domain-containing protein [Christensenellaceae bacterium OttesenSCG-928-K19]
MFQVYLVDDDPIILDDVSAKPVWQECGFEIAGKSTSSREALKEILERRPDLVMCDLKMPGLDGIDLMTQVKNAGLDCEFLMLSAYASFQDSRDFFKQDGFDYLLKPVDEMELQIALERLARLLFHKNKPGTSDDTELSESAEVIDSIMAYIRRNFAKKLTLSHLGQTFHFNPNYICNLFAKQYGQTFTTILTSLRMNEAARLISSTSKPLKEIAAECGYANYFYFCRVFKEFFGCAPSEYGARQ